ncbi:glycosyltransferase [Polaribacter sp. 20A6]|uniref:glycosyltransferase n=1 Tax=Polaribacter sp. 20A6 TaxID=2687289 RepID=UPI0013FE2351|nr:glycosyltransferase [Polaribacter sp. 20A6]
MKIALLSPNKSSYSETFIQQHRREITGTIIFYFNGNIPKSNDKYDSLCSFSKKVLFKIKKKLKITTLKVEEQALLASFKKEKIEIVVAEYGMTAVAVLNVCKKLKIPLIPIFHGYDASVESILVEYDKRYKSLFKYSKKIIAVSHKIKETLISMTCEANKIIETPCAPSDSFFELTPEFKSQTFFGVGRFVDKKAPYYTILAFQKVLKQFPEAQLKLAGDGPLFNSCLNIIRFLKIGGNVTLLGRITPEEVKNNLINSIAFVQHSIVAINGDSEGTPVAILEASATGLPVISTFHAGIEKVIINNESGFLVDEHDVEAMAEKMIMVIKDVDLSKKMGELGCRYIKENFSKDIHIAYIDNAIKDVLNK